MTRKVKLTILIWVSLMVLTAANFVLAADFGVNEVNNGLGGTLTASDPRVLIGRIIQIALGFLGVIAVLLIMYAGFLWTTSGGDEEKISRAKKILRDAIIGLIIILASWGIATFILSKLGAAIGVGQGGDNTSPTTAGFSNPGVGTIGACSIDSVYPSDRQDNLPRNTSVMVTFKEELKTDSICVNDAGLACACNKTDCNKLDPVAVRIYKSDLGDSCSASSCPTPNANVTNVLVNIASGNKTLILTPVELLGNANGNTPYTVKFTNAVKKLDNSSMFSGCGSDYGSWSFTVNNNVDLTPPIVALSGEAPKPDNNKDVFQQIIPAVAASGKITVGAIPHIYSAAEVQSISPASATVSLDYNGSVSQFRVSVPADAPDKAQLFDGNNNLLGVADFNGSGIAVFKNYFTITAASHPAGSLWTITIKPEQLADTLTVNDAAYTFGTSMANNNIQVPTPYTNNAQAANIAAQLSGNPDLDVSVSGNTINVQAKVAGQGGNNIALTTTNSTALAITPLSGGSDRQENSEVKGQPDRPMNSVIQINFNKPINPMTASGSASEISNYLKIVNANASSSPSGASCTDNSQCASYKCNNNLCAGDYLSGNFVISNNYKTVEFISDQECGVNGCGEKIYCLPANSHLTVKLKAANLKACNTDSDCAAFNPFKTCAATTLGYKTCQNTDNENYPTANIGSLDGVVDASLNSLDGDRSTFADGPIDFYNANNDVSGNNGKKDNYQWSFYVNNKIMLTPPQVVSVSPAQGQGGYQFGLADPVEIHFNTLMMNSTLRTGSIAVTSGTSTVEHKLINLRSSSPTALGYWVDASNIDTPPLDGQPDITYVKIFHSPFPESVTFKAQVGSGVKDIYQNCYKPSVGPDCSATASNPSCCFGTPTASLGADGNCR